MPPTMAALATGVAVLKATMAVNAAAQPSHDGPAAACVVAARTGAVRTFVTAISPPPSSAASNRFRHPELPRYANSPHRAGSVADDGDPANQCTKRLRSSYISQPPVFVLHEGATCTVVVRVERASGAYHNSDSNVPAAVNARAALYACAG